MSHGRLHLFLTVFWALLVVPTILWWKDNILVVLLYSVYANLVGHWGAYEAARKEGEDEAQRRT